PWGSLTVAEGNFDHPVNGQKVNERAAGSAPGQGTGAVRRGWMRDASDQLWLPDSVKVKTADPFFFHRLTFSLHDDILNNDTLKRGIFLCFMTAKFSWAGAPRTV
ncbi:MAG: hypothetical protein II155_01345, partial [Clostridia bacterium]|nr:hypothetical protein [Clostridia bacterium]